MKHTIYLIAFLLSSLKATAQEKKDLGSVMIRKRDDGASCVYYKNAKGQEETLACMKTVYEARLIHQDSILVLWQTGNVPHVSVFVKDSIWKLDFNDPIYPICPLRDCDQDPDFHLLKDTNYFKMYAIDNYQIKCIRGGNESIVNWNVRWNEKLAFWEKNLAEAARIKKMGMSKKKWYQLKKPKS